jgi:hypothetical protein
VRLGKWILRLNLRAFKRKELWVIWSRSATNAKPSVLPVAAFLDSVPDGTA